MLVNPQFFNYRFTIYVLVAVISVLAFLGYNGFSELKSENAFLNNEKMLIQNEITKVIYSNNKLEKENKVLSQEIENYKEAISTTSDSVKTLKSNTKRVVFNYERIIDDIQNQDDLLEKDNDKQSLESKGLEINSNPIEGGEVVKKAQYNTVKSEINKFSEIAENAPLVLKASFKAKAYRIKNETTKITSKASRTNNIEVCFTLSNDRLSEENAANELYIQIIDPNNNVVSDKGAKKFDDLSLIYSLKTKPVRDYEDVNICEYVYSNEKLAKGIYLINIFDTHTQLASTKLELY